jgi:hypothetical protein
VTSLTIFHPYAEMFDIDLVPADCWISSPHATCRAESEEVAVPDGGKLNIRYHRPGRPKESFGLTG